MGTRVRCPCSRDDILNLPRNQRKIFSSHIESLLAAGTLVLCDRYAFSGIAFSASKRTAESGDRPALTYEWCRAPERLLPAPDLTIFLDIDAQSARARCGYGEERYERADLQARVREVFRRIGNEMGASRWVTIDAAPSQERVQELVWAEVQKVAEEGIVGPIHRLWDDVQLPTSV
jgi:dTMP kinase